MGVKFANYILIYIRKLMSFKDATTQKLYFYVYIFVNI